MFQFIMWHKKQWYNHQESYIKVIFIAKEDSMSSGYDSELILKIQRDKYASKEV